MITSQVGRIRRAFGVVLFGGPSSTVKQVDESESALSGARLARPGDGSLVISSLSLYHSLCHPARYCCFPGRDRVGETPRFPRARSELCRENETLGYRQLHCHPSVTVSTFAGCRGISGGIQHLQDHPLEDVDLTGLPSLGLCSKLQVAQCLHKRAVCVLFALDHN
jgi:hypothetical protein